MGVRAKIEAVIYAAEEPVTLAQLAQLFGEEALAERGAAETRNADAEEGLAENPEEHGLSQQLALNAPADAADNEASAEEKPNPETDTEPDADAEKRAQRLLDRRRREAVRAELNTLMAEYDAGDRGMEVREIAGGYRVATRPEYHDAVRAFAKSLKPAMKLTLQALETLAVIAYKQPVTAPEVSEIRGVDSGGVMGSLISRKLVTTAGRKQVVGRPILYKTTKEFLLRFGLKDLAELPSMEEFEKMAGELQALGDEPSGELEQSLLPVESDTELEVPQEPELSVIVVEEAEPAEPGVQVVEGGAAVSDAASIDPSAVPPPHQQEFEPTTSEPDRKDESNHG